MENPKMTWRQWFNVVVSEGFAAMCFLKSLVEKNPEVEKEWLEYVKKNLTEFGHQDEFDISLVSKAELDINLNRAGWLIFDKAKKDSKSHEERMERKADRVFKSYAQIMTQQEEKKAKKEREAKEVADLVAKMKAEWAAKRAGVEPFKKPKVIVVKRKSYKS